MKTGDRVFFKETFNSGKYQLTPGIFIKTDEYVEVKSIAGYSVVRFYDWDKIKDIEDRKVIIISDVGLEKEWKILSQIQILHEEVLKIKCYEFWDETCKKYNKDKLKEINEYLKEGEKDAISISESF